MGDLLIDVAQATGQARRQIREEERQDELLARQQENDERKIRLQGEIQKAIQRESLASQEKRQDKDIEAQEDRQKSEHSFQRFLRLDQFKFQGGQNKLDRDLKLALNRITVKDAKDARAFRAKLEKELIGLRNGFQGTQKEKDRQFNLLITLINNKAAETRQSLEIASREKLTAAELESRSDQLSLTTFLQIAQLQAGDIGIDGVTKQKTIEKIKKLLPATEKNLIRRARQVRGEPEPAPESNAPRLSEEDRPALINFINNLRLRERDNNPNATGGVNTSSSILPPLLPSVSRTAPQPVDLVKLGLVKPPIDPRKALR